MKTLSMSRATERGPERPYYREDGAFDWDHVGEMDLGAIKHAFLDLHKRLEAIERRALDAESK